MGILLVFAQAKEAPARARPAPGLDGARGSIVNPHCGWRKGQGVQMHADSFKKPARMGTFGEAAMGMLAKGVGPDLAGLRHLKGGRWPALTEPSGGCGRLL
jgi:hypothetical protein